MATVNLDSSPESAKKTYVEPAEWFAEMDHIWDDDHCNLSPGEIMKGEDLGPDQNGEYTDYQAAVDWLELERERDYAML